MIKNLYNKIKRDKSAFTIIELLVVIAVLAILVLLAIPRVMGQVDKARVAQITNDIAVVERKVSEQLIGGLEISEWEPVSESKLSSLETEKKLHNKKGRIGSENAREPAGGGLYIAPSEFVKSKAVSKLKGSFIVDEGGGVHYSEDEIKGTPPREEIPDDYEVVEDTYFTWVKDDNAPYSKMRGENGYNLYTGEEEYVIIPKEINGEIVKNYYKMFSGDSSTTVKGVASESKNITNMSRMFEGFPSMDLDITHLDTDNVLYMPYMFSNTNIRELDITYFNTSNVIDMSRMFDNSNIGTLELGKMELNNVETMYKMFMDTNTDKVDLAGLSAPKLTNLNQMFKGAKITNVYMNSFKAPVGDSMYGAFRDMEATSVNLSNAEISKEFTIEENGEDPIEGPRINQWFASSNIKELNVSNLKAYNISNAHGFLRGINSDNIDASELYIQGNAIFTEFLGGANVTGEVNLNNAHFPNAENLWGMFEAISADRVNLNNLIVSEEVSPDSSSLQMNQAFMNSTVKELNMENISLNKLENVSQLFLNSNINKVNISNLDGPNLYHMHGMFEGIDSDVVNINGFRVSHESGGSGNNGYDGDFVRMSSLFSKADIGVVSISNFDAPNSIQNHGLFEESKIDEVSLVDINIGSADWIPEQQASGGHSDEEYTVNKMFAYSVIGNIKFENFRAPYMRDYHGLFKNAVVGKVDLSGLDTSGASRMPGMFQNAVIESVDLSTFDTSNVTAMGRMFENSSAKELDLRSFDTSKVEYMDSMFNGSAATHIDISSFRNDSLLESSGIFANTQFEEIDLSKFDIMGTSTGISAFINAKAKRVYVPSKEIADKFNNYTVEDGKPEQLTFYVK